MDTNLIQQLPATLADVAKAKATNWANHSIKMTIFETTIADRISALEPQLPTSYEQVPEAEARLKELKQNLSSFNDEISALTTPINGVVDRLNAYKKPILNEYTKDGKKVREGYIPTLEAAIIKLKKDEEERVRTKEAKAKQLKDYELLHVSAFNNFKANCMANINSLISMAFNHAIDKVPVAELSVFLQTMETRFPEDNFKLPLITDSDTDEKKKIINDIYGTYDIAYYEQLYKDKLKEAFVDFVNAKNNSDAAKAQLQKDIDEANRKAEVEANNVVAAAQIVSSAVTVSSTPEVVVETKGLKKSYDIDMEDSYESMKAIDKAFYAMGDNAFSKLRNSSVFTITIMQKATALAKCKSEDNNLSFEGIKFKEVDKL